MLSFDFIRKRSGRQTPVRPVTQEQFKAWTDWAKKSVDILDSARKNWRPTEARGIQSLDRSGGGEQAVDLNAPSTAYSEGDSQATSRRAEGVPTRPPKMETYFDLNLINQPGITDSLAFDNYHSLVFFDLNADARYHVQLQPPRPQGLPALLRARLSGDEATHSSRRKNLDRRLTTFRPVAAQRSSAAA